jgi:hypothetical protein
MAKHTPGPWKTEDIFEDGGLDICIGYEIEGAGSPVPIAHVVAVDDHGFCPKTKSEVDANARLMAAAPELLEIVRHVHLFLREGGTLNAYALFDARTIYQAADEVIRKAEGSDG